VICCDGTSNQFGAENTNVLRLYSVIDLKPGRLASCYDPGVGTFASLPALTKAGKGCQRTLGLAFGHGLTKNVAEAYRFLMQNWKSGDRVFMFGFSRGAYTVRVLAGMIHKVGLLHADNTHLVEYADRIFKNEFDSNVYDGFRRTFARACPIHFLGLWDTVSSVGWVWDPVTRPHTANNPGVSVVRHAVAIDERRAFFRQNLWDEGQAGVDLKQVWFAGCHSDIGGAQPLSKLALEWMLVEAKQHGLELDSSAARELLNQPGPPNHRAPIVESLTGPWRAAEFFPKRTWDSRRKKKVTHFNRFRPRRIADDALVHESAFMRKADEGYAPENFPSNPQQEAWVRFADSD